MKTLEELKKILDDAGYAYERACAICEGLSIAYKKIEIALNKANADCDKAAAAYRRAASAYKKKEKENLNLEGVQLQDGEKAFGDDNKVKEFYKYLEENTKDSFESFDLARKKYIG